MLQEQNNKLLFSQNNSQLTNIISHGIMVSKGFHFHQIKKADAV